MIWQLLRSAWDSIAREAMISLGICPLCKRRNKWCDDCYEEVYDICHQRYETIGGLPISLYRCPCGGKCSYLTPILSGDYFAFLQHCAKCPKYQEQKAIWLLEKGAEI